MIKDFRQVKIAAIFCFVLVLSAQNAKAGIFDMAMDGLRSLVKKEQNKETPALVADEGSVLRVSSQISSSSDQSVKVEKDEEVLKGVVGPVRLATENEVFENDQIQVYEVKVGDTLSDVAKMFNVSRNTIAWANDIKNGKLTPGDTLLVLPVSGVKHTVKKGDTIKSIAKKYKADTEDILSFNDVDEENLVPGDVIVVPDGEVTVDAPVQKSKPKRKVYPSAGAGYYVRPIIGGIKTQGIHGHNGVDIGAPVGSPILAAADGVVLAAKSSGYNGGYGKMIIISHPNGTQTVYGHLSNVYVTTGQSVSKGEQIGESGNTGRSTGPHLHFEVRGAENPF